MSVFVVVVVVIGIVCLFVELDSRIWVKVVMLLFVERICDWLKWFVCCFCVVVVWDVV